MSQVPDNGFPKFSPGDPASKALEHKFLNKLTGAVGNVSRQTIGQGEINNASGKFVPRTPPAPEIRLVKVLDIGTPGAGSFAPSGKVNVVKAELIDAVFAETVGSQDLSELDAADRIVYAAASPAITLAVNDFTWVTKWSGQWWVTNMGGAATLKHGIVTAICDQDCSTYEVEIVNRTFVDDCSTGTGTA